MDGTHNYSIAIIITPLARVTNITLAKTQIFKQISNLLFPIKGTIGLREAVEIMKFT